MQRRRLALAGAAAGLLGMVLPLVARAEVAETADEEAVAAAVEALREAMVDVDEPQLRALTADQLSYGHSAGKIETKAQFIAALTSVENPFRFIRLRNQTISVAGDNAIVRHLFEAENVTLAGQVSTARIGVLQVWTRQGQAWRLLARQAFRV